MSAARRDDAQERTALRVPSETERAARAAFLGALLGAVLVLLERRR
jgi:hypothetical protein